MNPLYIVAIILVGALVIGIAVGRLLTYLADRSVVSTYSDDPPPDQRKYCAWSCFVAVSLAVTALLIFR